MPEPQRTHAVRILVEEARAANTCPALLTAHITTSRSTGNVLNNARRRAQKRMLEEIPERQAPLSGARTPGKADKNPGLAAGPFAATVLAVSMALGKAAPPS